MLIATVGTFKWRFIQLTETVITNHDAKANVILDNVLSEELSHQPTFSDVLNDKVGHVEFD